VVTLPAFEHVFYTPLSWPPMTEPEANYRACPAVVTFDNQPG
jgi:hypothetical protein